MLPGWTEVRFLFCIPWRQKSHLPRDRPWGKEERKRLSTEPRPSSAPLPPSDSGRFLLSSTDWIGRKQLRIHLIFNGSSWLQDTEEQSKQTESTCKQKHTSSLTAFFFFSSGRTTWVPEHKNVNLGFAHVQPCFPTHVLSVRQSSAGEGAVRLSWCSTRLQCMSELQRPVSGNGYTNRDH